MRTIILSDAHGEPDVIRGALAHAGFDAGVDRLIFAGDAIEVGRDSAGCLGLLEELGAEVLVGNHEYALFVDRALELEPIDPAVEAAVAEGIGAGVWKLAAEAQGVLVSHAGFSGLFATEFQSIARGRSLAEFVDGINRAFRDAMISPVLESDGVCGPSGPLWYRPMREAAPLGDVVQVAGHTPVSLLRDAHEVKRLSAGGFHLVDPNVRRWRSEGFPPPAPLRYAVVEFGEVRVVCE
jgi:hypothetical protein